MGLKVVIGIAVTALVYAISLLALLPWNDLEPATVLCWFNPLIGILCVSPVIYMNLTFALLSVDAIIQDIWQHLYTRVLIALWVLCAIGMWCYPEYYFALFATGLIGGGIRALLFRGAKLRIGADQSWKKDLFGTFSWFATSLACMAGFVSAGDAATWEGAKRTLWYNAFVFLFSLGAVPINRRDWQIHLACLSKAVGWRNLLGEARGQEK